MTNYCTVAIEFSRLIGFNYRMKPAWAVEDFIDVNDDRLDICGISAADLAEIHGTPLFVFSEAKIRQNIEKLQRAQTMLHAKLKICYAAKANSVMGILRTVLESGIDLEVNSGGELYKALKIGFLPQQIIFNGTSKSEQELSDAINAGIYAIQADSVFEIELAEKAARKLGKRANISLRLVPEIKSDTLSGLQTALLTSKFGMMPDEALSAFKRWKPDDPNLNLCGIHLHIGSQNPSSEPYAEALTALFKNLLEIYEKTGHRLSHLNLGGGFPVNYLRDTSHAEDFDEAKREMLSAELDPAVVIGKSWNMMRKAAEAANASHLIEKVELLIEPGRSVISDAGLCLTTVRNKKDRPVGKSENIYAAGEPKDTWLLTDAGFNILLSMETYKWYYHLISASRAGHPHKTDYKVAGPLCDGGDVYFDIEGEGRLPDYRKLPDAVYVGEVLALLNCGAYSLAQMSQYNGRQLPAVVLIRKNGEVELIRKRDSFDDLINNDVF